MDSNSRDDLNQIDVGCRTAKKHKPSQEMENGETVYVVEDQNALACLPGNHENFLKEEDQVNHEENKVVIDGLTRYGGVGQPNLKFIKVNVDCWEHVFDFLSLRDILAMSQTCQRMLQIGGRYIRDNFHGTIIANITTEKSWLSMNTYGRIDLERDDFLRFIDTVVVEDTDQFQAYSSGNLWTSLTALYFYNKGVNGNEVQIFANVLANLESITFYSIDLEDNSLGQFLASCPKLKFLQFDLVYFSQPAVVNSVFERTYPMLTDFHCTRNDTSFPPLTSFLERNSSIKNFATDCSGLLTIQFYPSTIRLDCLCVYLEFSIRGIQLATKLKALHTDGYYKKLHILISNEINLVELDEFMDEMTSFSALEVLHTRVPLPNLRLNQLKDLFFQDMVDDIDLEAVAKNLINLERLWIRGTVDTISPFLQYSKKLKTIIFEPERDVSALDLFNMNEVRKMCSVQRKVQIGVAEPQYLATKCKAKHSVYDLVEIARLENLQRQFNNYDFYLWKDF